MRATRGCRDISRIQGSAPRPIKWQGKNPTLAVVQANHDWSRQYPSLQTNARLFGSTLGAMALATLDTVPVVVSSQFFHRLDGVKTGSALRALIGDFAPLQDALTCKHCVG